MCVALSPEMAVTSFISCVAEEIHDKGNKPDYIFSIRFNPTSIVQYTRVLQCYDDITRYFDEDSLNLKFRNEWKDIFETGNDDFVKLRKDDVALEWIKSSSDVRQIVPYLLYRMQPKLNEYAPRFLKKIKIY